MKVRELTLFQVINAFNVIVYVCITLFGGGDVLRPLRSVVPPAELRAPYKVKLFLRKFVIWPGLVDLISLITRRCLSGDTLLLRAEHTVIISSGISKT